MGTGVGGCNVTRKPDVTSLLCLQSRKSTAAARRAEIEALLTGRPSGRVQGWSRLGLLHNY